MNENNTLTAEAMPPKVAAAIIGVMADVPKLGKGEKNQHGNYNFASIDDFLEAVRPLCAKHGLIIMQDEESFEMKEGWLIMTFRFTLAHSSGETWGHRPTRTIMVSAKMGSQAFGAAQSYALKQYMRSLFQIATGEKGNDADEHPPADLPGGPKKAAPKKETPEEPKQSAAAKFADTVIAKMEGMETLDEIVVMLRSLGLFDENEGDWILEENTKLAKLRDTAPDDYARVHAAYNGRMEV
jgi:hypothetical protein